MVSVQDVDLDKPDLALWSGLGLGVKWSGDAMATADYKTLREPDRFIPGSVWPTLILEKGTRLWRVETKDSFITVNKEKSWFLVSTETLDSVIIWKAMEAGCWASEMMGEHLVLYCYSLLRDAKLVHLTPEYGFQEAERDAQKWFPKYTPSFETRSHGDNGVFADLLQKLGLHGYFENSVLGVEEWLNPPEVMLTTYAPVTEPEREPWPATLDPEFLDFTQEMIYNKKGEMLDAAQNDVHASCLLERGNNSNNTSI